jgi:RNA polymerase sigma-70 factor (ECF subfamily)
MRQVGSGFGRVLGVARVRVQERELANTQVPEECLPSDGELMARVQSNDSAALECLFSRYGRLVLRIARGVVRDAGEAEDILQESFFYLYKKSALFDGSKGSVKNWILQIALHRALDRKSHLVRCCFYASTDIASLEDILAGGATDPDREIGARLVREQLRNALAQLSELQRLTLELVYFEGLSLRDVSQELREPLGNTRHHFYRGLARLRKNASVQKLRDRKNVE